MCETKRCTKCGEVKPMGEFYKDHCKRGGYRTVCKMCDGTRRKAWNEETKEQRSAVKRTWYEANKERVLADRKAYYADNPVRAALGAARRRARQARVPFNLTPETTPPVPTYCPILGIEMVRGFGKGQPQPNSPSLDRIVPALGYVPGNVVWISHRANTLKSNSTVAELQAVLSYMLTVTPAAHHGTDITSPILWPVAPATARQALTIKRNNQ